MSTRQAIAYVRFAREHSFRAYPRILAGSLSVMVEIQWYRDSDHSRGVDWHEAKSWRDLLLILGY